MGIGNLLLMVEDDPDTVALMKWAFERSGVKGEVVSVNDGVAAIDYMTVAASSEDKKPFPKAVLLDLKLPRASGMEVLRRIRADNRTSCVPVVVFTVSTEEKDIVESYSNGANSYVRKPVDFSKFVEVVGELARYWLVMNVPHCP